MPNRINPDGLPAEVACTLFNAWVQDLALKRFNLAQYGSSGNTVSFGDVSKSHFVLREDGLSVTLDKIVGLDEAAVLSTVEEAIRRVAVGDLGRGVVYLVEMTITTLDFFAEGVHFMRVLGDQVHIEGHRRLFNVVLLDFQEGLLTEAPAGGLLLAPESKVRAAIFAPGPCHSDFSRKTAAGVAELTAAVCALAAGRPVQHSDPMFPAEDEDTAAAISRRGDSSISGLARDSISLDVFGELPALGGMDAQLRARGALLAYHAALNQSSTDVAVMLFVTCIEALISPRLPWGRAKITQRFVKSVLELCPAAVDSLLDHPNIEVAIGFRRRGGRPRQRRDLLNAIYEARSLPTHTGIGLSPAGFTALGDTMSMRVALLSSLSRAALLAYLSSPRSSLIGHPSVDPVATD